jgi:leader peptidase (prepilin peptidase)/N-methyltransferase
VSGIETEAGLPALAILAAMLAWLSVIDARSFRLPDRLTLLLLLYAVALSPIPPDERIIGLAGAPALLAVARALVRFGRGVDGLGFGDVKLSAACGAWLGPAGIGPMLLIASLAGLMAFALRAVAAPADGKAATLDLSRRPLPFGPFLSLATLVLAWSQRQGLFP